MRSAEELRQVFWQEDERDGGMILRQYSEIKAVLAKNDLSWSEQQYRKIKQHAIRYTEFYREMNEEDIFPVMNKQRIIHRYDAHKANGGFALPLHTSSTSGSTGTPFSVIQDCQKRKRMIADLQVFGERCDFPIRERMVSFRIVTEKMNRTPEREEKENIYYVDCGDMSEQGLEKMLKAVLEKQPRTILGYASTLAELAKHIDKHGNPFFCVKSVLTAGEGISTENRLLLEKAFHCKVYRRYADMELGILGQDHGAGDAYDLNWGSYYFECLKLDCDEPAEDGEVGRIVITDLFNYAFPMIRYDTGDLGVMKHPDHGGLPYLAEIYGRQRDCVYTTDGRLLSPAKISVSMWGMKNVNQWQFIQHGRKEYELRLNCCGEVDSEEITEKLKDVLGDGAEVAITYVDEVPILASHKRRAVICNYER